MPIKVDVSHFQLIPSVKKMYDILNEAFQVRTIDDSSKEAAIDSIFDIAGYNLYKFDGFVEYSLKVGFDLKLGLPYIVREAYDQLVNEFINEVKDLTPEQAEERIRQALGLLTKNPKRVPKVTFKAYTAQSLRDSLISKIIRGFLNLLAKAGYLREFYSLKVSSLLLIASIFDEINNMVRTGSFLAEAPDLSIYDENYRFTKTEDTAFIMERIGNCLSLKKRAIFYEAVNLDKVGPALSILVDDGKPALARIVATHFVRKAQDATQPAAGQVNPDTGVGTIEVIEIGGKQINKKCLEDAIRSGKSYEDAVNSCAIGG